MSIIFSEGFRSSSSRSKKSPAKPSISRTQSPADVQGEREASKLRLLDVWSSLAERYTRRLDEDDIVDIRTGEITLDRGFLRNSRKVDFGAIAAPATGDVTVDAGTDDDEEEEEDEYDVDELDAFADTTPEMDNVEQSKLGLRVRPVPPMTALDSADAEDLRAFLEAERRRKQLCGSEDDDDDDDDDDSVPDTQGQGSEVKHDSAADLEDLDPFLLNDAAYDSETYFGSQTAIYVNSSSEDELDNWDIDESSAVYPVLKQEDNESDIEIIDEPGPRLDLAQVLKAKKVTRDHSTLPRSPDKSTSTNNTRTPSKPYVLLTPRKSTDLAKSKTEKQNFSAGEGQELRRRRNSSENKAHSEGPSAVVPSQAESPHQSSMSRKRKCASSDSGSIFTVEPSVMPREEKSKKRFTHRRTSFSDDLPYYKNQASTFYMIPDNKVDKPNSIRRSSSRSQRPRPMSRSTVSSSESVSGNSSDSEREYSRKPPRLYDKNFQSPSHHHYPHHHQSYIPSPHRRRRQRQHHPPPFVPPIPDPRAQFIITQAMQQLSALVGTPWTPPHDSSSVPYTPSRRHQSRRANSIFNTPSFHSHPYPCSYDPNLSLATLPPESPELTSSPEKSLHGPRKSSMAKSRPQGRRVSFKIDDDDSGDGDRAHGIYSSPSNAPSLRREAVKEQRRQNSTKSLEGKGTARAETPSSGSSSEDPSDCGSDRKGRSYSRGRTPGPNIGPLKGAKPGEDSKGRLKGVLKVVA